VNYLSFYPSFNSLALRFITFQALNFISLPENWVSFFAPKINHADGDHECIAASILIISCENISFLHMEVKNGI
jgi:hypothetical protein